MKKSQYSMEFLIFFALISIVFSVWLVIYSNLNEEAFFERDKRAIIDLGKSIQKQIFLASNAETGYHSDNLIIPDKATYVNFEINNSNYVFFLETHRGDFPFHIPYTIGKLKKGKNSIWGIQGVVCIAENPDACLIDVGRLTNCTNKMDDDGDFLIDKEDGGCWVNYNNPSFNYADDNETPSVNIAPSPPKEVYNYYLLCKNANISNLCGNLSTFLSQANSSKIGDATTLDAGDCDANTFENFCS